nr:Os09g0366101 [Ipomoea batatas]
MDSSTDSVATEILQVELAGVFLPEPPFFVAQHLEIVDVEVPQVDLAHVGRQHVGVLRNDVHGGVEPECVNPVTSSRVGIQHCPHHVIRLGELLRWRWRSNMFLTPSLIDPKYGVDGRASNKLLITDLVYLSMRFWVLRRCSRQLSHDSQVELLPPRARILAKNALLWL